MLSLVSSAFPISKTLGPVTCPSKGEDVCEAYYNISYDWPSNQTTFGEEQLPEIIITDHPEHAYENTDIPPLNITTWTIIIDGIRGTVTNASRFFDVNDAINTYKSLDPDALTNASDQEFTRNYWLKYGSLDGEWQWMKASYNLSNRGNGASGIVHIFGWPGDPNNWNSIKITPAKLMHVIGTIQVNETLYYTKYVWKKVVSVQTSPIYETTQAGPL